MKIVGFTINLQAKENEDAFFYWQEGSRGIAVVADGITRDPIGMPEFPDESDEEGIMEFWKKYPKYSHAKKAAGIFCKTFFDFLMKGKNRFDKAFEFANFKIKALNKDLKLGSDYLEKDFAGCTAVGVEISKGTLNWGFVTDCGLAIFNSKGLKFRTENFMKNTSDYMEKVYKKEGKTWNNPEMREFARRELRNKEVFSGKNQVGYGAFTGEEEALNFLHIGKHKVFPGDHIFLYSDGMEPIVYSKEFEENLKKYSFNGLQRFCRMKAEGIKMTEGSLIAVQI
jgi:serine/threonine protein phosphatase PrpC